MAARESVLQLRFANGDGLAASYCPQIWMVGSKAV
jgi:hypothetical protein